MQCNMYEKFSLGLINSEAFSEHVFDCETCKMLKDEEDKLNSKTLSLRASVHTPLLWDKIENSLRAEKAHQEKKTYFQKLSPFLKIAAILLFAISLSIYFNQENNPKTSGLLSNELLEKVEQKESDYIKAIQNLEQKAQPKIAELDVNLMLLYQERLEIIDDQIERCRNAVARNPANAHIRGYLLAALQDKKHTLNEILKATPIKEELPDAKE